jgi:hypothetical protein
LKGAGDVEHTAVLDELEQLDVADDPRGDEHDH